MTSVKLSAGDIVLVLAKEGVYDAFKRSPDFLLVSRVGDVVPLVRWWDYGPIVLFFLMLVLVTSNVIEMAKAALTTAGIIVLCGWVDARKLSQIIDWSLVILISSALGISEAVTASGLSEEFARSVSNSDLGPWGS